MPDNATDDQIPSVPSPGARRTSRSFLASLAAAAVLAGAGGVAVGHAWGDRGSAATNSSSTSSTQWVHRGGSGGGPGAFGGYDGWTQVIPPAGQGSGSQGQPGTSGGAGVTRAARGSELIGLVRISTRNAYDGNAAAGTGMVLTSTGEVLTNHHVVEGATSITATVMATGKSYTADVVGTDAPADVAVLHLRDASGLATVSTSTTVPSIGDAVTAVGDAGGSDQTFTAAPGRVSALHRAITTQAEGAVPAEHLTGLMQLSSDVTAGDSGGPTYDAAGKVVGMTTAASAGGRRVDGYAVPIARALAVARDLEAGTTGTAYTYGRSAFLGIALQDGQGTIVQKVYAGTPAASAGLRAGDRITQVGTTSVRTLAALRRAVAAHRPGQALRVTWRAMGRTHSATLTLAAGPVA